MPCTFIKSEAPELFDLLTNVFKYKLKLAEIGITDLLIYKLTEYCDVNHLSNVAIYHAKQESVYGADIDLFVEQTTGKFIWFALQAKVMNHQGVYKDLRIKKKSPQQWEKLKHNEATHGAKAYYLFYNGDYTSFGLPTPTRSDCQGVPGISDYGYGIVERRHIEAHFSGGALKAKLTDFYPHDMDALRKLLCCDYDDPMGLTEYAYADIHTAAPYVQIYPREVNPDTGIRANPDVSAFAPFRIVVSKPLAADDPYDISLHRPMRVLEPLKFKRP